MDTSASSGTIWPLEARTSSWRGEGPAGESDARGLFDDLPGRLKAIFKPGQLTNDGSPAR